MPNPNYLKDYEVKYEIVIRGGTPASKAEDNRRILRGLMAQESANRSVVELDETTLPGIYSFRVSIEEITKTLESLEQKVADFSLSSPDEHRKRIQARLIHVSARLQRLTPANDAETAERVVLLQRLLLIEGDFDEKANPDVFLPPALPNPMVLPTVSVPLSTAPVSVLAAPIVSTRPSVSSTPISTQSVSVCQNPVFSPVLSPIKKVPVYKWGLTKFSGRSPLLPFLEVVESLKFSRGCDDADLFNSASDLFEGDAWTWWLNQARKGRFSSWSELVVALKDTFSSPNADHILLEEIKSTKQTSNESVALFISGLEAQISRLSVPLPEKEVVSIIRRNLLPTYIQSLALHEIGSVVDLVALCKKVEEALVITNKSVPTCLYVENRSNPSFKCWNCGIVGHKHSVCRKPKSRFCFGCGRQGVTRTNCGCSKNVNQTFRTAGSGESSTTSPAAGSSKQ